MRAKKLIVVSLALAALCAGCSGRELANVTLLQTVGIDGPGPVTLTAVGDGADGAVYRTVGESAAAAREGLRSLGTTRLETTHMAQLVLGPDVDVAQCLWRELTHRKSGYGATVWLCAPETTASAVLEDGEDLPERLRALEENGGVRAPTILEALSALSETGRTELPVLAVAGGEVRVVGYKSVEVGA